MNEVIREIIIDADIVIPSTVTADSEYSMPVIKEFKKADLFRHNTLVAFDGSTYQYIGQAPYGSEEDEAVWKVTRVIYDATGNKVVSQIWNNQKWSDYKN